jgi:hypothetical protein
LCSDFVATGSHPVDTLVFQEQDFTQKCTAFMGLLRTGSTVICRVPLSLFGGFLAVWYQVALDALKFHD